MEAQDQASSRDGFHYGGLGFPAHVAPPFAAIAAARESIRLETYIYSAGSPGDEIRDALTQAAKRGVQVKLLIDDFGSYELPRNYWTDFIAAGGSYKAFNPMELGRIVFRNHRKLLVCDNAVAFIGGFNITHEEAGDGVTRGWRDLGLRLDCAVAGELADDHPQAGLTRGKCAGDLEALPGSDERYLRRA